MAGQKLVFLTRSLDRGGAERQLALLAGAMRHSYEVKVLVFYPGGALERLLLSRRVDVECLHKKGRWDVVGFIWRLYRILERERPDALYSFLGTSNILAVLMKLVIPGIKVVMGVRSAQVEFGPRPLLLRVAYWLECRLSLRADLIICNSQAGRTYAARHGFPADKMAVVANGIDADEFRPDPKGRARLRAGWNVAEGDFLIGLVGRLDPIKDHTTFLRALEIVTGLRRDVRAICVGDGPQPHQSALVALAAALRLEGKLIWAQGRDDMRAVYSALDVLVSTSLGEGFSNAIGEAMACGVPCVVTDVGDSAWIVGAEGIVVPPRDPPALAAALERMLVTLTPARQCAARGRIESLFSPDRLAADTDTALQALLR